MRPQKVQDIEIMTSLVQAFRSKGYEGTSLAELAKSTGLKKASLYHRFPKGKEEMANAVLDHIEEWVDEHIFKSLLEENTAPKDRLLHALNEIRNSYDGGKEACIFRALSIGQSVDLFDLKIKNGMKKWIHAFEKIGFDLGLSEEESIKKSMNTLIKIQGSLIVTKGFNDLSIFENTLKEIEYSYLNQ